MVYPLLALLLFCLLVAAHILFCRNTTRSGLHAKVFVLMAMLFLCVYAGLVLVLRHLNALDPHSLWGMPFGVSAAVIFTLLVPIYLCFYVLTQLTSPSKKILSAISQGGELSYGDILTFVRKEGFIETRLDDLCASGCVVQAEGRYILTSEGRKIAMILNFMQWVLGRDTGG